MNSVHRAIIFYLFLLVFLISAPLVVLYTSGYRYSFRTGRIARVGALILKSVPRGAVITVNNRLTQIETPASIELTPDEYRVEIAKEGFHPWVKLLSVASQKTTFAEDIILWKNAEPRVLTDAPPPTAPSNDRTTVIYDTLREPAMVWSVTAGDPPILTKRRAGDSTKKSEPVAMLATGAYELIPAPYPYLILHETIRDRILLINLETPTEIVADLAGQGATYRLNRNNEFEILTWNAFELWRANAITHEQELLRRQGEPITATAWYPSGEYVAIASGDRVEMIELDARGGRNATTLARFPDHRVAALAIDPDGATMLITVDGGTGTGLYSLELQ